jgi:hypothetical protein
VDEEGARAEQRQRLGHAAARVEQHAALVGDEDARALAVAVLDMRFELVGEVVHVDHRGLDARRRQPVEHMIDQRTPGERDERLRRGQRERAHALALARGENHCCRCLSHGRLSAYSASGGSSAAFGSSRA